jgi:mRNA interferase MazF
VAAFVKGDVVVLPFPFSDLSQAKRRPALLVANLQGDDAVLVQITSQMVADPYSIPLNDTDFAAGKLSQLSNVRPNRIFTADTGIILYKIGSLNRVKLDEVVAKVVEIIRS